MRVVPFVQHQAFRYNCSFCTCMLLRRILESHAHVLLDVVRRNMDQQENIVTVNNLQRSWLQNFQPEPERRVKARKNKYPKYVQQHAPPGNFENKWDLLSARRTIRQLVGEDWHRLLCPFEVQFEHIHCTTTCARETEFLSVSDTARI